MRPDAELKVDAVSDGLSADELQHFQVAITFFVRQIDGPHVVTRECKEKRISEQEIRIANIVEKVVADAEVQTDRLNRCVASMAKYAGHISRSLNHRLS